MHVSERPALDGPGGGGGVGLQKYVAVIELSGSDSSVAVKRGTQSYLLSKCF